MLTIYPLRNIRRVYCAGPLFNVAERREMCEIAEVLSAAGFHPFLPHADGMEFANVVPELIERGYAEAEAGALVHEAIFALDVYHVAVGCGSLVFNLNGRVPDEGGVAEAAIAWTLGKPIVLVKNDVRSAVSGRDNPLVAGLVDFQVVRDLTDLPGALAGEIAAASSVGDPAVTCPPRLAAVIEAGTLFWNRLSELDATRPSHLVADAVENCFGRGAATR